MNAMRHPTCVSLAIRVTAIGAALAAALTSVFAQPANPPSRPESDTTSENERVQMSPFVVTSGTEEGYQSQQTLIGSRTSKNLLQLPAAVTVINKEQIDDLNAVTVADVIKYGVSGISANASHWDDFDIRGFRAGGSMRNGVATPYQFGTNEPMYDIERVEVIKGPAAMLLGNNTSIGGGINFVPIAPSHTKAGYVQATVSTQSQLRLVANSTGPLFKTKDVSADYRFTLGGLTGNPKKENWTEDQKFVGAAATFYFGDRTSLTVNTYFFINDSYAYLDNFVDLTAQPIAKLNQYSTETISPAGPNEKEKPTWDRNDFDIDLTYLNKLSENGDLRLFFYFRKLDSNRTLIRGLFVQPDNYHWTRQWLALDDKIKDYNFQADYQYRWKTEYFHLDNMIGADWAATTRRDFSSSGLLADLDARNPDYSSDNTFFSNPYPTNGKPVGQVRNRDPEYYSYYFQENLGLWNDRITLVGGLRWYNPGGYDHNHTTGVITKRSAIDYKVHKYGVVFAPAPWISLYYTDAENVIPMVGTTDRFHLNDGLGDPLKDQLGVLKEYGVKFSRAFSERFSAYGSAIHFKQALTNVRTSGPLPGNPSEIGVIQTARDAADGWEFDLGLSAKTPGGRADLLVAYLDATGHTAADPSIPPDSFVPTKISLLAKYAWQTGPLKGFMAGVAMEDQGTKRYSAVAYIDVPKTWSAFARYQWNENWDVQLNLDNLTDERYIVAVATDGLVDASEGFRPRLSLKYRW